MLSALLYGNRKSFFIKENHLQEVALSLNNNDFHEIDIPRKLPWLRIKTNVVLYEGIVEDKDNNDSEYLLQDHNKWYYNVIWFIVWYVS